MGKNIYYPLEENFKIVLDLFGHSFVNDIKNDSLKISDCVQANEILAEYLYGLNISHMLKEENIGAINDKVQILRKKYDYKLPILSGIDFNNLGLVIVRPENVGIIENYEKFLEQRDLSIIYKKKIQINFEKYLLLYSHGLIPK